MIVQPLAPSRTREEYRQRRDQLIRWYSCSVTSGKRTKARNRRKGGHRLSKHLVDMADDLVADDILKHPEVEARAKELGLWAENEGDHVHIQGLKPGPISSEWWEGQDG